MIQEKYYKKYLCFTENSENIIDSLDDLIWKATTDGYNIKLIKLTRWTYFTAPFFIRLKKEYRGIPVTINEIVDYDIIVKAEREVTEMPTKNNTILNTCGIKVGDLILDEWKGISSVSLTCTGYGLPEIKDVIFSGPATIVIWADGSEKTVVKCDGEMFDKEKGLAMAILKKINGNKGNYNDIFRKWCGNED